MQLNKDPPAEVQKGTYLYNWEAKVRKFFKFFEMHKEGAHESIQRLETNPFTRTQEFLRFLHRFKAPELYELRQQLGDISSAEVKSVRKAIGKESAYYFRKARSEPAKVLAYRKNILLVGGLSGLGFAYTMLYHRKGFVWWVAPFIPLVCYVLYNRMRQPWEETANVYRFILAKRTATAQMQEQEKTFAALKKTNPKLNDIAAHLQSEKKTLYELEQQMIADITNQKF